MVMPSVPELLIILVIIVLLFGAKKIPDLAKGLGSGIKNFKKAIKDDEDSIEKVSTKSKEVEDNIVKNTSYSTENEVKV